MPDLPDSSLLDSSEKHTKDDIYNEAEGLLAANDYDGLEKAAAKYQALKSPRGSSYSPVYYFLGGVTDLDAWGDMDNFERAKAWANGNPDNGFAQVFSR